MKFIFVLVVCLSLFSCEKPYQSKISSSNNNFDVELLFVIDGLSVYRFRDKGETVYFVDKSGSCMSSDRKVISAGTTNHIKRRMGTVETVGDNIK